MHAMVLDSVEEITDDSLWPDYETGDHKLIFKNTYDSAEYGKEKQFMINAKDANAPDAFYYIHINVDLDQIADCTCQGRCFFECRQQKSVLEIKTREGYGNRRRARWPSVFIGNIPLAATEYDFRGLLGGIGQIQRFRIMFDRKTKRSRGTFTCVNRA